jgi:hypothetical protein
MFYCFQCTILLLIWLISFPKHPLCGYINEIVFVISFLDSSLLVQRNIDLCVRHSGSYLLSQLLGRQRLGLLFVASPSQKKKKKEK